MRFRLPSATRPAGLALAAMLAVTGCIETEGVPTEIKGIAKSSVDYALDMHLRATTKGLEALMRELYRLNPQELAKVPDTTIDDRVALLLPNRMYGDLRFGELNRHRDIEAMKLAFEPRFLGDRVFALMVGLVSQMRIAYNDKKEYFALDRLNAENLDRYATNLEIVQVSMQRRTASDGTPLLRYEGEPRMQESGLPELTVSQIMDRLIGHQHVLVDITSDWARRIPPVAVRTVGVVLLMPLP